MAALGTTYALNGTISPKSTNHFLYAAFRQASNALQLFDGNRWVLLHGSNYFLVTFLVTFCHFIQSLLQTV